MFFGERASGYLFFFPGTLCYPLDHEDRYRCSNHGHSFLVFGYVLLSNQKKREKNPLANHVLMPAGFLHLTHTGLVQRQRQGPELKLELVLTPAGSGMALHTHN